MRRFQFRLERVLKWKQQRERLAELRQQQARVILDAALAQVEQLASQIQQTAADLEQRGVASQSASVWLACYQHTAQLGQALEQAEGKVRQVERQLQQANAARARIATEVESLQLLKRQQWQEHRRQRQRLEQTELDEAGMNQWLREQQGDG
ncbi:MAG TPA: hypothetical protein VFA18_16375 [Gemmataceae bacterium]|nr:hypothetical protein [Gemmataceae bacterium]